MAKGPLPPRQDPEPELFDGGIAHAPLGFCPGRQRGIGRDCLRILLGRILGPLHDELRTSVTKHVRPKFKDAWDCKNGGVPGVKTYWDGVRKLRDKLALANELGPLVDGITYSLPDDCPKCEKRLWKADVEFPIGDEDGKRWEDLRKRRQNRDTCVCTIRTLDDPPGKHRVFESLPGSYERYEPDLAPKVPTGIRPDLVVGLANNPKSSKLLGAPSKDDPEKEVGEVLKSDIFANMGNPANMNEGSEMIFPFLVLEAKRASAPDSLESIARQMALPAYEMLRMQSCLLADSTASQIGGRLPRVWLVSFKGQCWRLYVATAEQEKNGEYVYNIYDMWDGDITRTSNALKLVLLLDGIFDWALDIYRLDIFKRLESMVSRGAGISSTSITPTVSCLSDQLEKMTIAPTPNSNLGNLDTVPEDTLDVLEYKGDWVRDARRLLISGEGLLLTSRNIAEIFDNFEHPDHAKRFARLVWTLLSRNAWVFRDKYIFDRIREVWTGETRKKQQISEVPIFMQLEVYDFFDIYWRLRRGLIFVAATKDSIPELFNRAGYLKRHQDEIETMQQEISQQEFLSKLRTERQRNTVSSLGDALARWHRRLSRYPNGNVSWVPASVPSCDKLFQEIFRMYKAGQREPSESFLQICHGQSTVELEPGTLERTDPVLVVGDTDKRDWAGVIPRNRAPPLCLLVYEDLEILDGRGVEQELLYRLYIQTHISHFTDTGIVTKDGVGRPIDAVICATGANVDHHCPPFSIIANGLDLKSAWRHDRHFSFPYNYLGVATPGFPNLLWIGGSVPNSVENQIVYIAKIVRKF
ncbi:hypothetical protein BDW68DRAFT_175354 [Aspergillus falconensis]